MKLLTKEQYLKQNLYNSAFNNFMPLNEGEEVGLKDSIVGQLGSGLFNIGKYLVGKVDQRMKLGALRIKAFQYTNIILEGLDDALAKYSKNTGTKNNDNDNDSTITYEELKEAYEKKIPIVYLLQNKTKSDWSELSDEDKTKLKEAPANTIVAVGIITELNKNHDIEGVWLVKVKDSKNDNINLSNIISILHNNTDNEEDKKGNNEEDAKSNTDKFVNLSDKFIEILGIVSTDSKKFNTLLKELNDTITAILANINKFKEFLELTNLDNYHELKKLINLVENIKKLINTKNYDLIKNDKDHTTISIFNASKEMLDAYKKHTEKLSEEDKNTNESFELINEALFDNLGSYLTGIQKRLSKYPKEEEFKNLASTLIKYSALKLIAYQAKVIIGGIKKDQDPLDNKLNTFWEKQMLIINKNFNEYIDMDALKKGTDISTLSENDKDNAESSVDLLKNTKMLEGHSITTSLTSSNIPYVLQVYGHKNSRLKYNIVCTYIGLKDNLHWFKLYDIYAWNQKWNKTDLDKIDIKNRANDVPVIFCIENLKITTKIQGLVLFNNKGLVLSKTPKLYQDNWTEKMSSVKTFTSLKENFSFIEPIGISGIFKLDKIAITNYELTTTTFSSRIDNTTGFIKAQNTASTIYKNIHTALDEK